MLEFNEFEPKKNTMKKKKVQNLFPISSIWIEYQQKKNYSVFVRWCSNELRSDYLGVYGVQRVILIPIVLKFTKRKKGENIS